LAVFHCNGERLLISWRPVSAIRKTHQRVRDSGDT
jgi:hypothetical protein